MKLNNFHQTDFDVTDEWIDFATDRIVREMMETQLDESLLNEGIKEFLAKGAEKIKAVVQKAGDQGEEVYDRVQVKVLDVMVNKMPEVADKLKQFAGNHKTAAAVIAVVGASLLAMEPAAASQAMDTIAQQDVSQIADAATGMISSGGDAGVSPKLISALTDKMDGIFKASTEGGLKALSGTDAVQQAAEAHGVSPDKMIEHLMKNVQGKEELVNQFKKWVGAGIKKKLGMGV